MRRALALVLALVACSGRQTLMPAEPAPAAASSAEHTRAGTLFVANPKSIAIYEPPYKKVAKTVAVGVRYPTAIAVAPNGTLFVINGDERVAGFRPPYASAPFSVGSKVEAIAVDSQSRLIESSLNGGLRVYQAPYTSAPATFGSGFHALGLFVDAQRNLFAAGYTATQNVVEEFASPYAGAPKATITNGLQAFFGSPIGAAEDAAGDLFVVVAGGNNASSPMVEYAPPYTGSPKAMISTGVYWARTAMFGADQKLLILNCGLACSALGSGEGNVSLTAAPYSEARMLHARYPASIALGPQQTLFVLGSKGISMFAPPYRHVPQAIISSGVSAGAAAIAVSQ